MSTYLFRLFIKFITLEFSSAHTKEHKHLIIEKLLFNIKIIFNRGIKDCRFIRLIRMIKY